MQMKCERKLAQHPRTCYTREENVIVQLLCCVQLCDPVDCSTPGGTSGKKHTCQCGRHRRLRLDPWVWKIPWRRKGQPTPAFLPGGSQGQRSLAGCSPWASRVGHNLSDLAQTAACQASLSWAWKVRLQQIKQTSQGF